MRNLVFLVVLVSTLLCLCTCFELKNHNYEEMVDEMEKVNEDCPSITHIYNLYGDTGKTKEGRELKVIVFAKNPTKHEPGKYFSLRSKL